MYNDGKLGHECGSNTPSTLASSPSAWKFIHTAPLFSNWFAIQMYKQFLHLTKAPNSHVVLNSVICDTPSKLVSGVVEQFTVIADIRKQPLYHGRGVMCNEMLRNLELTQSAQYAYALNSFLFSETANGACFHQFPVHKYGSRVEKADLYVAKMFEGYPLDPILLSDVKVVDMAKAELETCGYCLRAMEARHGTCTWTVNLGLAIADREANLFLAVEGNGFMEKITICSVNFSVRDDPKVLAFFRVLRGAVHSLLESSIYMDTPGMSLFRVYPSLCLINIIKEIVMCSYVKVRAKSINCMTLKCTAIFHQIWKLFNQLLQTTYLVCHWRNIQKTVVFSVLHTITLREVSIP